MTTRISLSSVAWQRSLRGWFGVLLMVVSLLGGYRVAARMSEETSSQEAESVQEYAHRQGDGASTRRSRADRESCIHAVALGIVSGSAASSANLAGRLRGESPPDGHLIANGLCAPLRC